MNKIQKLDLMDILSYTEQNKKSVQEKIYSEFSVSVYYTCLKYLKDPDLAQDFAHDIFIKVFLNLDSFKGKSEFKYWILAITRNYCLTYLRLNKRKRTEVLNENHNTQIDFRNPPPTPWKEKEKKLTLLEEKFLLLSDKEQHLLTKKYYQNISVQNLAIELEISRSATKMRLKRGREKLKKMML